MSLTSLDTFITTTHTPHPHSYFKDVSDVSSILAALFFILALHGLSKHETAARGNAFGIVAMTISVVASLFDPGFDHLFAFLIALVPGSVLGYFLATRVIMTAMPQLVALCHSFVGLAAVLVSVSSALTVDQHSYLDSPFVHRVEIFVGAFIGSVTVTGSLVAAGKLHELIRSSAFILGGKNEFRHGFNLSIVIISLCLGYRYAAHLDPFSTSIDELLVMIVFSGVLVSAVFDYFWRHILFFFMD